MRARGLVVGGLVWLVALVGVLAFGALAAQATVTHDLLSQIKEVPASSGVPSTGRLVQPSALTVDAGDLYVADGGLRNENPRVDKFDASTGAFVSQFEQVPSLSSMSQGIAVGHATGETEVYIGADVAGTAEGVVAVFGPSGSLWQKVWNGADTPEVGGEKSFGCFECGPASADVAVDDSGSLADWAAGDVYVAAPQQGVVDVFKPKVGGGEEYVTQITEREAGVPLSEPRGVAVDPSDGEVLVVDADGVDVFEPTVLNHYALVRRLSETRAGSPFRRIEGVVVDGGNGDIYVVDTGPRAIDQFSSAGVYLGSLTGTTAGPFDPSIQDSLAVDSSTHDVYVGDGQNNAELVDVFGPSLVVPDVTTEPVSSLGPTSVTLNGTVDPDGAGAVTCRFDWGTSPSLGEVAPCSQAIPDGEATVAVQAGLSGLEPDTTYYYRLQASNAQGTNPNATNSAGEADREFTTPGPGLHGESVSAVTADSATLHAAIDPHNVATSYYFQYGIGADYGADVPAAPGAAIGAGEGDVEVAQHVQGLQAGTVYHYRVVALSEVTVGHVQEFDGPDHTFTAQVVGGEGALPDGRKWELVSPANKQGQLIQPLSEKGLVQASVDGGAISYVASGPTEAEPQGNANDVQVLSRRGSEGWHSLDIAGANSGATGLDLGGPEYRVFSSDLSLSVVQPEGPFTPSLSVEASEKTAYLRTDYLGGGTGDLCASSCLHPFVTGEAGYANVPPGTVFGEQTFGEGPEFVGATTDLSHVVLASSVALTRTPIPGEGQFQSLYEWTAGKLTLVSVLPKGEGGEPVGPANLGQGSNTARGAISSDGSRIFWQAGTGLYMRDVAGEESIRLDAVQGGDGEGRVAPKFQFASEDGSKVFFTDQQRLTSDAGASEGKPDLYECAIEMVGGTLRCSLHDLTPLGAGEEGADVLGGILGVSEDGSRVYFVADGAPVPGALYVSHFDGAGWEKPRLVAFLSSEDLSDWSEALAGQTARVSPDGEWLAFMSQRSLTGYDNLDAASGHPDEEVYLYHASGGGSLVCASCNPTGARPVGVEMEKFGEGLVGRQVLNLGPNTWIAASVPGWTLAHGEGLPAFYQSRYLSDSGRLFFDSGDALVPQDVNGTEDVYEYEPEGVPAASSYACAASSVTFSAGAGGCVGLISSGTSPEESVFLDASAAGGRDGEGREGGGDVFFLTSARLAGQDVDTTPDVYDAHECTASSPCPPAAAAPAQPCSTGDSCKPPLGSQPQIFGSPASSTFSGAGDLPAPAAVKGAVKARSLTRAQKLARALKACRAKKSHKKRVGCEALARRRYAAKASGRTVNAKKRGGR